VLATAPKITKQRRKQLLTAIGNNIKSLDTAGLREEMGCGMWVLDLHVDCLEFVPSTPGLSLYHSCSPEVTLACHNFRYVALLDWQKQIRIFLTGIIGEFDPTIIMPDVLLQFYVSSGRCPWFSWVVGNSAKDGTAKDVQVIFLLQKAESNAVVLWLTLCTSWHRT
jgi:hypothetical protein